MEIHTKDVENGILALEEVTLTAGTTLTEMEHLYAQTPELFTFRRKNIYGLRSAVSADGVTMRVYCTFTNGRLSQVRLRPIREKSAAAILRSRSSRKIMS